jgi:BON domain
MFRMLLRLFVVVVLLVGAAAFFFGYHWGGSTTGRNSDPVVGTAGTAPDTRTGRAREAGAKIGEQVAEGAARADNLLDETRLTAKVKSKIALDDTLQGSDVSVHTTGTAVTVEGRVSNAVQHRRVLQLVRETEGVTDVVDRLVVR